MRHVGSASSPARGSNHRLQSCGETLLGHGIATGCIRLRISLFMAAISLALVCSMKCQEDRLSCLRYNISDSLQLQLTLSSPSTLTFRHRRSELLIHMKSFAIERQ
ncbi:hypothetical protein MRB53_037763 [Persea americana]|nr:hypothetical protein MRB53_037763 [Persea americana]